MGVREGAGAAGRMGGARIMGSPLGQTFDSSLCLLWVSIYFCPHMEGPGRSNGLDLTSGHPRESVLFLGASVAMIWGKLVYVTYLWPEFT